MQQIVATGTEHLGFLQELIAEETPGCFFDPVSAEAQSGLTHYVEACG